MKNSRIIFTCRHCLHQTEDPILICPECNTFFATAPVKSLRSKDTPRESMWAFAEFLPAFKSIISLSEGGTPLYSLRNYPTLQGLWVKAEFRNPTGSFRDRASSLIVSHAVEQQHTHIINASTGSFSTSLAAYCASAGIQCTSVIPQNMELSKVEQLQMYNSQVIKAGDSLEDAIFKAKTEIQTQHAYHPLPTENLLIIEGQKTIGLEIALQHPKISDIIVPLGSGSLILSVYRGFEDAIASGWLKTIPRLHAVSLKETGSANLIESLQHQETDLLTEARKLIAHTGGHEMEIDPNVMVEDAIALAHHEGFFVEPASGSVISAAKILLDQEKIQLASSVAILSGSGINAMNVFASQTRDIKKAVWGVATQSTTKYEILNLIDSNRATHGYAIWESLGKQMSQQAIYQHLNELESKGLITFELGVRHKKTYKLSQKGLQALQQFRNIIDLIQ